MFCVFSGDGVQRLREYLLRLALDEAEQVEREGREAMDENLLDGEESPGNDTMSDDGTIDGNDQPMDILSGPHRSGLPLISTPRPRPRPHSLHDLPRYHCEMPLLPGEQMQRVGTWTPSADPTPDLRVSIGPPHLNLMSSSHYYPHDLEYGHRSRSPAFTGGFDLGPMYDEQVRSSSQGPSRRHTLESTDGLFGPPPPPMHGYGAGPSDLSRAHGIYEQGGRTYLSQTNLLVPPLESSRRGSAQVFGIPSRSGTEPRQGYLRPDPSVSAFDANHEAIMATIPGSRGASRHPSRSNSPAMSRVNSRSRLSNLLNSSRLSSSPLTYAEAMGARSGGPSRSRDRPRHDEEAHHDAMLRALAEADAARQLLPDLRPAERYHRHVSMPLLPPELMEQVPGTPITPLEQPMETFPAAVPEEGANDEGESQDVTMTQ